MTEAFDFLNENIDGLVKSSKQMQNKLRHDLQTLSSSRAGFEECEDLPPVWDSAASLDPYIKNIVAHYIMDKSPRSSCVPTGASRVHQTAPVFRKCSHTQTSQSNVPPGSSHHHLAQSYSAVSLKKSEGTFSSVMTPQPCDMQSSQSFVPTGHSKIGLEDPTSQMTLSKFRRIESSLKTIVTRDVHPSKTNSTTVLSKVNLAGASSATSLNKRVRIQSSGSAKSPICSQNLNVEPMAKTLSKRRELPFQRFAGSSQETIDFSKAHPNLQLCTTPNQATVFPRRFYKTHEQFLSQTTLLSEESINLASATLKEPKISSPQIAIPILLQLLEQNEAVPSVTAKPSDLPTEKKTWNEVLKDNKSGDKVRDTIKICPLVEEVRSTDVICTAYKGMYHVETEEARKSKQKMCSLKRLPVMYIRPECQVQRVAQISIHGNSCADSDGKIFGRAPPNVGYVECKHGESLSTATEACGKKTSPRDRDSMFKLETSVGKKITVLPTVKSSNKFKEVESSEVLMSDFKEGSSSLSSEKMCAASSSSTVSSPTGTFTMETAEDDLKELMGQLSEKRTHKSIQKVTQKSVSSSATIASSSFTVDTAEGSVPKPAQTAKQNHSQKLSKKSTQKSTRKVQEKPAQELSTSSLTDTITVEKAQAVVHERLKKQSHKSIQKSNQKSLQESPQKLRHDTPQILSISTASTDSSPKGTFMISTAEDDVQKPPQNQTQKLTHKQPPFLINRVLTSEVYVQTDFTEIQIEDPGSSRPVIPPLILSEEFAQSRAGSDELVSSLENEPTSSSVDKTKQSQGRDYATFTEDSSDEETFEERKQSEPFRRHRYQEAKVPQRGKLRRHQLKKTMPLPREKLGRDTNATERQSHYTNQRKRPSSRVKLQKPSPRTELQHIRTTKLRTGDDWQNLQLRKINPLPNLDLRLGDTSSEHTYESSPRQWEYQKSMQQPRSLQSTWTRTNGLERAKAGPNPKDTSQNQSMEKEVKRAVNIFLNSLTSNFYWDPDRIRRSLNIAQEKHTLSFSTRPCILSYDISSSSDNESSVDDKSPLLDDITSLSISCPTSSEADTQQQSAADSKVSQKEKSDSLSEGEVLSVGEV